MLLNSEAMLFGATLLLSAAADQFALMVLEVAVSGLPVRGITALSIDMISLPGKLSISGAHGGAVSVMIDGSKCSEHSSGWREIS